VKPKGRGKQHSPARLLTFDQHIGIDYSGAQTPHSRLSGLQIYAADNGEPVRIVTPSAPAGGRWNWTRIEVAAWLLDMVKSRRVIVGIDHGFSFPYRYFMEFGLHTWDEFLDDFVKHWPTHEAHTSVDFLRAADGYHPRIGKPNELRLTERWTSSAKSVFRFDVQGSVAKSTHAGIPWLRYLRREAGDRIHCWPFDGWEVPAKKSVLAEVYPSMLRSRYPRDERTVDEQDAYAVARWLHECDERQILSRYFAPPLTPAERRLADLEGWILGVG
jgi:hypothetical protein